MGKNLEKFLQKTGNTEPAYKSWATQVGQKMHINASDAIICQKCNIYTVAHLPQMPTNIPFGLSEIDLNQYIFKHSNNPYEIAQLWQETSHNANHHLWKEGVIAAMLLPFPKADFERFGDKNLLPDVSKKWFNPQGTNIDVQAMQISENCAADVTVQEIIDFVLAWKPACYQNPAQLFLLQIEARWFGLFGFKIKEYYANHLAKMAHLHAPDLEPCPF